MFDVVLRGYQQEDQDQDQKSFLHNFEFHFSIHDFKINFYQYVLSI